jgi:transposase, IS30 family
LLADKLEEATAEHIRNISIKNFRTLPRYKRNSITFDNGVEFADYETIEYRIGIDIYFAYPYRSWERGSNENTNGLIRQFFPKKSAFANISTRQIKKVARLINDRPRKRLGYLTPHELFHDCVLN